RARHQIRLIETDRHARQVMRCLHRTGAIAGDRSGVSATPIILSWKDLRALRRAYPIKLLGGSGVGRKAMGRESRPNSDYTRTWSASGEIEYATLAGGTRLRYLKAGSGPTPLVLLHTVRTQLDHFQLVIPRLLHAFTVYAIDLPGMGWSDITPNASYGEQ